MGRKTTVLVLQVTNEGNYISDDLDVAKKRIEKLITAQNNAIRTNYVKTKIDNPQKNSKCRLCDETVNRIIREWSNLAQKECKSRHDWVRKVIHWELCKKLKCGHSDKWYVYKPESILENETYEILWDFEIQMISKYRRLDLVLINKKKLNKRKQKDWQIPRSCLRVEKTV